MNVATSLDHCGACGKVCAAKNASATCTAGQCSLVCKSGVVDCNGLGSHGCEADPNVDLANRGACNNPCGSANATPSCVGGNCSLVCTSGYGDCDKNPANGCESNFASDSANCGKCGSAGGTPSTVYPDPGGTDPPGELTISGQSMFFGGNGAGVSVLSL